MYALNFDTPEEFRVVAPTSASRGRLLVLAADPRGALRKANRSIAETWSRHGGVLAAVMLAGLAESYSGRSKPRLLMKAAKPHRDVRGGGGGVVGDAVIWVWWCAMVAWALGQLLRTLWTTTSTRLRIIAAGALFRAAFPVRWGSRPHACLVAGLGGVLGSDLADRTAATVVEVSLASLASATTAATASSRGHASLARGHRLAFAPIVLAQLACWYGCATDNKLWHVVEESLWTLTFAAHLMLGLVGARVKLKKAPSARAQEWGRPLLGPVWVSRVCFSRRSAPRARASSSRGD